MCPKAEGRRILFSTVSNTPYAFRETFTCTDTSLIYCIVCDKCEKLYIGLTSNSLKVRFRAHRHSPETRKLIPLYHHFARKSHNFLRNHRIVLLEHCEPDALANEKHTGLGPYTHSSHMALIPLTVNLTTLITTLSLLQVSPPQIHHFQDLFQDPPLCDCLLFLFCKVGLKAGLYFNLGFPEEFSHRVFPWRMLSNILLNHITLHHPAPSLHLHTPWACTDKTTRTQPLPVYINRRFLYHQSSPDEGHHRQKY